MQGALRETVLLGLTNNNAFLQDVLAAADFQDGNVYTTWVEEHFGDWQPPQCDLPLEVLAAAALTRTKIGGQDGRRNVPGKDPFSPWRSGDGFRLGTLPDDLS
jgi:acetyl/propionyl-CoA carboxylase alpha subunit